MRLLLLLSLPVTLLAGCASASAQPPPVAFAGPPSLPATFVPADPPLPSLPAGGPVGRGALLYGAPTAPVLVLDNGGQFRLPPAPAGEGRQGSVYASLSPDGRWLGHGAGSGGYSLRELVGERELRTDGVPVLWSANGQFLVMSHDDEVTSELTLVEPATGTTRSMGVGRYRDGLWLSGVLPDGVPVFSNGGLDRSLRVRAGGLETTVAFAAGADDECWCPHSGIHLAPDGGSVSLQLAYDRGLMPGTGEKSPPEPANAAMVVVIDLSSGAVLRRLRLPVAKPDDSWRLLADTGSGLLLRRLTAEGAALVLLDPATGAQRQVTKLPAATSVAVPGDIIGASDG